MRRREMLAWSVATLGTSALSAFLPSNALAGACAPPGFGPAYRTVAGATLGRGGAILLSADLHFGGGMEDPFGGHYTLTVGGATIRLHAAPLAPGMIRLLPNQFVVGAGVVRGPAGELPVTLVDAAATPPAPCRVATVRVVRHEGTSEPYSPPTWGLEARLHTALPTDVVGVAVAPAAQGSAYGLYAVSSGDRVQRLYHSPGRCQIDMPGANPPAVGARVRLACVGANGTVSVRSNDVDVRD
ncbi:MAG: hypothetical protein IPG17_32445 [Sandaracinaceae bacterium]|nr:hypothetical protein [Sandaracinaceae bacterium]